jgi:deazaflavin-dependent oxidoreductase (nitroreductase family)
VAIADELAALPYCYLETIGRVTGRPHRVEMWFAADPERAVLYAMSGGRAASDWVLNLRREPRVRIWLGGQWLGATGREIEGSADEPLVRRLLAAKYQGWSEGRPLSSWARNSLPVALELDGPAVEGGAA